jgi:plasmid maintenance system antidote protein VapI
MNLNTKKIELELERIGKNQAWLAGQMKRTKQQVNYLVKNNNKPCGVTLKTIERIGRALGVDPKDLII